MKRILFLFLLTWSAATAQHIPAEIDTLMAAYKDFRGTVLVARGGTVLLKKGYGNQENTIYQIASVTKTFTATAILKLAERGRLSLEDKLSKYYPDYPRGDSITIRHLLTHTSGIYNYTMNREFMETAAGQPATEEQMLALFKDKSLDFSPGTSWNYSNSGYMLLGYIIQKVTGMTYEQALRKYLFEPDGMHDSGFDFVRLNAPLKASSDFPSVDPSVSFAAGSIYSTVGDLYKWHQSLQTQTSMMEPAYIPFKGNYGYGWIIDTVYGHKVVSHSGGIWGFRSNFARVPSDNICIVMLSNTETPLLETMTRKIFAILYHQPYQLPGKKKEIILNTTVLQKYVGTYEAKERGLVVEVRLEDGKLIAAPHRGPQSVLCAVDETHFFLEGQEDFEVIFAAGEKLIINNNGKTVIALKIN
ncbi:serine hydrolase domain-containing protein [Chitinophaga niabensis]|uniref:CubicO group peptidase, beta-lactamase class C family n=1 Tax=Chitinophaga niabensis TaxID=536979 RepID=A0A1N6KCS7_9BACT|nr:serine hydrolase domain-containing protein [Chitinophaga niabensis]SIO54384.1 CubicO group peptidase, beta-lactamase class C family [Chitinophaga niabensis]